MNWRRWFRGFDANTRARDEVDRRVAMSARGLVYLDENLWSLEPALRAFNIKVRRLPAGTLDEDFKDVLTHRILVTRNSRDFRSDASIIEYGIIALDNLRFVDPEPSRRNRTVQLLSDAAIDLGLWSRRHGFIVMLHDNGQPTFEALSD